jgi:hypothetical protein
MDAAHRQLAVPFDQFVAPAGLGGIDRQKWSEVFGILRKVRRHVAVGGPHSRESGFAAEHDRPDEARGKTASRAKCSGRLVWSMAHARMRRACCSNCALNESLRWAWEWTAKTIDRFSGRTKHVVQNGVQPAGRR